jgi:phosphoribosylaminoimidazolecarboxamide formyltransferase/IMP cyclohydrolase
MRTTGASVIAGFSNVNNWKEGRSMLRLIASVSDKTGLVEFVSGLSAKFGGDLMVLSTGGTAKKLREAKISVFDVAGFTSSPEVMDGRVKTLHPKIFGGLLARPNVPQDLIDLEQKLYGALIDLALVNLYPFAAAADKPNIQLDDLVEEIDIGGPSLVRATAKNFRRATIVVDPSDYAGVLSSLVEHGGTTLSQRWDLAKKAFAHTAAYDAKIAETLPQYFLNGDTFQRNNAE